MEYDVFLFLDECHILTSQTVCILNLVRFFIKNECELTQSVYKPVCYWSSFCDISSTGSLSFTEVCDPTMESTNFLRPYYCCPIPLRGLVDLSFPCDFLKFMFSKIL